MNLGATIAAKEDIKKMIHDFSHGYIQALENLHNSKELMNLSQTSEIEPQFLAAQIACTAIGSALGGYPGDFRQHQILLAQLINAANGGNRR